MPVNRTIIWMTLFMFAFSAPLLSQDGDAKAEEEETTGIEFVRTIEDAQAQAEKESKRVLVIFGDDNCSPCVMFKEDIWVDQNLADAIKDHLVCVSLNVHRHIETAKKYGLESIPAFVVTEANGKLSLREHGVPFYNVSEAKDWFDEKIAALESVQELEDCWFEEGTTDVGLELAQAQGTLNRFGDEQATLEIALDELEEGDERKADITMRLGRAIFNQGDFEDALKTFQDAEKLQGEGEESWDARHRQGECLLLLKRPAEGQEILEALYEEVTEAKSDFLIAMVDDYGYVLGAQRKLADMREVLVKAAKDFPDTEGVLEIRTIAADVGVALGLLDESEAECKKIIEDAGDYTTREKMICADILRRIEAARAKAAEEKAGDEKPEGDE